MILTAPLTASLTALLTTPLAITCCLVVAGMAVLSDAAAQTPFPSRPVSLVVPFPPGGATDVLGRVIALKMGTELGQRIVVENRAGAGTIVGASHVSKAPA